MFVEIDNVDMDALKVEEWINTNRDANGGVVSPKFAMEILTKTNHFAHIKKILKNITKACMDENGELVKDKVLAYKEFILSCVDDREMSPQAMKILQEMADVCGVRDEFDELKSKEPKKCDRDECLSIVIKTREDIKALKNNNLRVFFDADEVNVKGVNFKKVKSIKCRKGAVIDLSKAKNLPKYLDLSMCSKVDLRRCDFKEVEKIEFAEEADIDLNYAKNLPKDLDVSMCSRVSLRYCFLGGLSLRFREGASVNLSCAYALPKELDLSMCSKVDLQDCYFSEVERIKFGEGCEVNLNVAGNLPKELDFPMFSKVDLRRCNLSGVEKIKFGEGSEINLNWAKNLPKELDLSMCSRVDLSGCDLEGLELKFREGAEVNLEGAENLPKNLDVSMCSKVDLSGCNLEGLELKFREGAEVLLVGAHFLPDELDLSMCSKVGMSGCNLSGVKRIKFKDKEQEKEFMDGAKGFSGKVKYDDMFARIRDRFGRTKD